MTMTPLASAATTAASPRRLATIVSAVLAASAAHAQQTPAVGNTLEEITVTAQKRAENLQAVPISVQAFDTKRLEELHITDFNSVAKYLPSVSFQTSGPSQAQFYFRGLSNGSDGLKTGSQPMTAVYLDDQPVTSIGTSLDVHIYDMERIEAIAGPQGTLFGASAMAGLVRYITNKPDTASTYGGYDISVDRTKHGGTGEKLEGYANIRINDQAAIRLVGFGERDAGYINNVAGPYEVYPTSGIVRDNSKYQRNDYNNVGTSGGRAALKIDLNDRWTVLPTVMYQKQIANGSFGYEPAYGYLNVATYEPERNEDRWYQSALTITGKIGNFDLVYSGGYLRRTIDNVVDYSDYSYAYDVYYASNPSYFGDNFKNNAGQLISPAQYVVSHDTITKRTHELRLSTKTDYLDWVIGVYYQANRDDNYYRYTVDGLSTLLSITDQPGVHYLNSVTRNDSDRAAFTQGTLHFGSHFDLTAGVRVFDYLSKADGFFGFPAEPVVNNVPFYGVGEALCSPAQIAAQANPTYPCLNVNARGSGGKYTDKVTAEYKFDNRKMVYATYSTGFRAGGFNRNPFVPPYKPDFLTNYEFGWKTQWAGNTVRFNGDVFRENWKDSQYGVNGQYAITQIINAGGARTEGLETNVEWQATDGLNLSTAGMYLWKHALTGEACYKYNDNDPAAGCGKPSAYAGTAMPVSPSFKANLTARYEWRIDATKAYMQASGVYQTKARALLDDTDNSVVHDLPGYGTIDVATGLSEKGWTASISVENLLDSHGQISRYLACSSAYCTNPYVVGVHPRRIALQFGQKF